MCGPSPRFHRVTLTVVDFRRFFESPYDDPSLSAKRRISQGKTRDFRSIYPPHIRSSAPDDIGLSVFLPLCPTDVRLIRFVCLGPELCLWLLSHPALLRRSCHSARGSCHQGPQRTFTSKSLPVFAFAPRLSCASQNWRFAPCLAHKKQKPPGRGGFFPRFIGFSGIYRSFLRNARATRPVPRSSSDAGSGTARRTTNCSWNTPSSSSGIGLNGLPATPERSLFGSMFTLSQ